MGNAYLGGGGKTGYSPFGRKGVSTKLAARQKGERLLWKQKGTKKYFCF
jgi:hypothetical protein